MLGLRLLMGSVVTGLALLLAGAPAALAADFDFGDAPDGGPTGYPIGAAVGHFPSRLVSNGARAPTVDVHLGTNVDVEADAHVTNLDKFDDGVVVALAPCAPSVARVTVTLPTPHPTGTAYLQMFFDWNRNGSWGGFDPCAPEWAVRNFPINLGAQTSTSQQYTIGLPAGVNVNVWFRAILTVGVPWTNETGAGAFTRGEVEDYPPRGPFFGAKCVPKTLALFHGQQGNIRIVALPGSAPILSTQTAQGQATNTPQIQITKIGPRRYRFRSKKVDPPKRTILYIVRIRVKFGTSGNIVASIVKKCVVTVTHADVFSGARCTDVTINHGQSGVLRVLPLPGSAPILSSGLASSTPANTADRSITKNGAPANSFTFRSKKVDPPPRTVLYIVRIRVKFGTAGNIVANTIVKCEVRVVHDAKIVTVTPSGTGTGQVTSTPAGINCFPTCTGFFEGGTVTLNATAGQGSRFLGWSGACSGETCTLNINGNKQVTATFGPAQPQLTVALSGSGSGFVAGPGINCSGAPNADCSETYPSGTQVALNCSAFVGSCSFSGCDTGNGTAACGVTMTLDRTVTCDFPGHFANELPFFSALRSLLRL